LHEIIRGRWTDIARVASRDVLNHRSTTQRLPACVSRDALE
jgi:hypothetical protein